MRIEGAQRAEQKHDIKARVVGLEVHGADVEILIASGTDQDIVEGMTGYLVNAGGLHFVEFTVRAMTALTCKAKLHTTATIIEENKQVVINPSKV